jgi:serine/threonine protein kinase
MSSVDRFNIFGPAAHQAEADALEWLRAALPDHPPYSGWSLFTFQTEMGHRYEIDACILTAHAFFLIELKSWKGTVVDGDVATLTMDRGRGREVLDHPLPLLTKKSHALMNRAKRVAKRLNLGHLIDRLRYEEIVWLTHAQGVDEKRLPLASAARSHVIVGRTAVNDLIRQASFPGAREDLRDNAYAREMQKALTKVLAAPEFGLKPCPRDLSLLNGRVRLGGLVEEGRGYQDHWTEEKNEATPRRRVRSYLVPANDPILTKQIEVRASREAAVLRKLGEHPDVLALDDFDPQGPFGPALIFRGFDGASLDRFVQSSRDAQGRSTLSIDEKLTILDRVAHALAFCHRNDVVHGALSPDAVLVRRLSDPRKSRDGRSTLEVKLTRFALAIDEDASRGTDTRLLTRMAGAAAGVYEAPEVTRGAKPTSASDVFSLGALAYFLFAEEHPAKTGAELLQRLHRDDGLMLSAVRSDIQKELNDAIYAASHIDPLLRAEAVSVGDGDERRCNAVAFAEQLVEALTVPADVVSGMVQAELDPLDANRDDHLGDLLVRRVLGVGATARALKVSRVGKDDIFYALKVPSSDEQNDRLAREGDTLESLGQIAGLTNISKLVERREFCGKTCLLVEFAGDRSLADELREGGAVSLEFARRWGEDLLLALRALEEAGVQHRDIKPANIGLTVGVQKQKKRLVLFDFSLSSAAATEVSIGTPAYKDPALAVRGRWDDAADRWAAAVTLYEMFTATRPAPDVAAKAPKDIAVEIDADRFDADVRAGLTKFFERCFRFGSELRFSTADDMREAFVNALTRVADAGTEDDVEVALDEGALVGLGPEASVQRLPLSSRSKNALDRMGIATLHDLAQLRPNWLSGVRGVGTRTARLLVEVSDRVRRHLESSATDEPQRGEPFYPGWHGRVVGLMKVRSRKLAARFVDACVAAGIEDSAQLAAAPRAQVKNLINKARQANTAISVKDVTIWLKGLFDVDVAPSTLRAAVFLFAPQPNGKARPSQERLREYLGLVAVDDVGPGNASALAARHKVSRQAVSLELQKFRNRWKLTETTASVLVRLFEPVYAALIASGGAAPLSSLANVVIDVLPPETDVGPNEARLLAEGIVRILCEVDTSDLDAVNGSRLLIKQRRERAVVAIDTPSLAVADALGAAADAAVGGDQVLVEEAAEQRLRTVLTEQQRDGALDERATHRVLALPARALVELSVTTAAQAERSVRGELYPRGLQATRALALSASTLQGPLTADEVSRRVRARYPGAAVLPGRPALDELLRPLKLVFSAVRGAYVPEQAAVATTELIHVRTPTSELTSQSRRERNAADEPGRPAFATFQDELRHAVDTAGLRVLLWRGLSAAWSRDSQDRTPDAVAVARAVANDIGGTHVAMDHLLLREARAVAQENEMDGLGPALAADAAGPRGEHWQSLVDLMKIAAGRVETSLMSMKTPVVITGLGALARYGQLGLIHRLARPTQGKRRPAAQLIVLPAFLGEGAVVQVGADVAASVGADPGTGLVPLGGLLTHEILEVPSLWVERNAGVAVPKPLAIRVVSL